MKTGTPITKLLMTAIVLAVPLPACTEVLVESSVGRMNVELIKGAVRRGNVAMYFPEANELVPGRVDPNSKTPSFKRTQVKISPL